VPDCEPDQHAEQRAADHVQWIVDADVHAREGNCAGEQEQRRPESRERERQDRRGGEARRSMSRRKRRVVRGLDERFRFRVAQRRSLPVEDRLEASRRQVGKGDGDHGHDQDAPASIEHGQHERDSDPQQTESPGVGEPLEERVQPPGAVVDHPALEVPIRRDQAGTICFV
jgi:hypothetical protein